MEQAVVSADVISSIDECFNRCYLEVERTETEVARAKACESRFSVDGVLEDIIISRNGDI